MFQIRISIYNLKNNNKLKKVKKMNQFAIPNYLNLIRIKLIWLNS